MDRVLPTLVAMMRLRSGPQDLPAERGLLFLLVFLYVAQGLLAGEVIGDPEALPRTVLAIAVQFAVIAIFLRLKHLRARTAQTLSAMAGTGFLFGLLSVVILAFLDPETQQPGLAALYMGLFVWSLAVDGHIYRHALSIKMSQGVLTAVLIFAANFTLLRAVFG